jgi:hypothetical protein
MCLSAAATAAVGSHHFAYIPNKPFRGEEGHWVVKQPGPIHLLEACADVRGRPLFCQGAH